MDWDELQRRARHVVPKQELKARRCWIGVLDHRKSTDDNFEEADFIWMIGHSVSFISRACVHRFADMFSENLHAKDTGNLRTAA